MVGIPPIMVMTGGWFVALLFQHSSEDGTQDISRWVGDLHNAVGDSDTVDSDSAVTRGTQWEPSLKGKVEIIKYHDIS